MGQIQKLKDRLLSKPKDFTYDELRKLLFSLGCIEDRMGKTSGSRVAFIHKASGLILRLHKPHPGNELKRYQVEEAIKYVQNLEAIIQ